MLLHADAALQGHRTVVSQPITSAPLRVIYCSWGKQYDAEDEDGTPMAMEGTGADMLIDPFMGRPAYLADPDERGIKRVGLIYSPRKSWWAGVLLVLLSIAILTITLVTAFW